MKKIIIASLCAFLWSGQSIAACNTSTANFVDHGNGTVTHKTTGLMWKKCSEGLSGSDCATGRATSGSWESALQAARTLNTYDGFTGFAGFSDWRVPNKQELASIVQHQCLMPSINTTVFPATINSGYWSKTPEANTDYVYVVLFGNGKTFAAGKNNNGYLRLVREGE